MTKLWSALMLKLTRLIVRIKNAFRKKDRSEETATPDTNILLKSIKEKCESHDYCEQCEFYFCFDGGECLFVDANEGIPCYWEVDE